MCNLRTLLFTYLLTSISYLATTFRHTEFTRVREKGVHYKVEPASKCLQPNQGLQPFGSPSIAGETEYQRLLNMTLPPSYRRPYAGPSCSSALVEVPDDVLSSPTSTAPGPPQHSQSSEFGPLNSNWHHCLIHINNLQLSPRNEEASPERNTGRNRQGYHQPPSPPADINITQFPNMHLYRFYASDGECINNFSLGSSIQYTAIDIVDNEGSYSIQAWYRAPPNDRWSICHHCIYINSYSFQSIAINLEI